MRIGEAIEKVRVWGLTGILSFIKRKLEYAIVARRLNQLEIKSRGTIPTRGVTVVGDMTAQVSLSKTLRDFVLSLKEAGIPCQTYDTCLRPQIPAADVVTADKDFNLRKYDHLVVMYRAPIDAKQLPELKMSRIVFHECEHGLEQTAPYLWDGLSEIIAMSDFNYNYYKRIFPNQRVVKVLYPLRPNKATHTSRSILRGKYGIKEDDFVVYFNFDFGSYYRKNVTAAVRAFHAAFSGAPEAKLLFKSKGAAKNKRQCREVEALVDELKLRDKFVHISSYLPREDVDGLANACDVYLSLHRGEGFGLGMAEAMLNAKPVVATDWSSNTEFCNSSNSCPVPYSMVPIKPHEYMLSMKEWAEADVEAAAKQLRRLYEDPKLRLEIGEKGKDFITKYFDIKNVKCSVERWLGILEDEKSYGDKGNG